MWNSAQDYNLMHEISNMQASWCFPEFLGHRYMALVITNSERIWSNTKFSNLTASKNMIF